MKPGLLIALMAVVLGACRSQVPRHPVENLALEGATVVDNGMLGWDPSRIRSLFADTLRDRRQFELLEDAEEARRTEGAWSLSLELPFTREALKDGSTFTFAEVGATLKLERRGVEPVQRYEVVGLGEIRVEKATPEGRRKALREALRRALTQVADSAALQMSAADRSDAGLLQDLQSTDERMREFALRVLAERRNPAAAPLLMRQLQDEDPQVVRKAIGALVEMRARSAVPALIDLVKGHDAGFVQEVVFAIGEIGGAEAEAWLFTMAQGHDLPAVQAAAQQALDTLYASRKLVSPEARGSDRVEH